MMEKINIAGLLKNCPKGMELDCTCADNVVFDKIIEYEQIKCVIGDCHDPLILDKYGRLLYVCFPKCVIFPKGKTTWEGFVPPCKFKDGDIIFTRTSNYTWVSIFKKFSENRCCTYIDLCIDDNDLFTYTPCLCTIEEIITQRLATEEEKAKLFQAIKDNGYTWNAETKTLERLIVPKFKVGDKIKHKTHIIQVDVVTEIKDTHYILNDESALPFTFQDEYEVVPNKFNINTLVPFESKVLVRNDEHQYWIPAFWGCKRSYGYITTFGWCKYCIPFEGNEHLLETNKDCNEHYKTWK